MNVYQSASRSCPIFGFAKYLNVKRAQSGQIMVFTWSYKMFILKGHHPFILLEMQCICNFYSEFDGAWNSALNLTTDNVSYASTPDQVFTPDYTPFNRTFSDWAREWWQWHLSIPDIKENNSLAHPRDNYSPEKCSWNQNGSRLDAPRRQG